MGNSCNSQSSLYTTALAENGRDEYHVGELSATGVTDPGSIWRVDRSGKPYIFISNRGPDTKEGIARPTHWFLMEVLQVKAFLDAVSMPPSDDQPLALLIPAHQCTHALVLLSPGFRQSEDCVRELNTFVCRWKRGSVKLIPALWGVPDVKGYCKVLKSIDWLTFDTTDFAEFMHEKLWPFLMECFSNYGEGQYWDTLDLKDLLKCYVEKHRGKPGVPPIPSSLERFAHQYTPQESVTVVERTQIRSKAKLAPVVDNDSLSDTSSTSNGSAGFVGIDFSSRMMEKKCKNWNANVLQAAQNLESQLAQLETFGRIQCGNTNHSVKVQRIRRESSGTERAVVRLVSLTCVIELRDDLKSYQLGRVKQICKSLAKLLVECGASNNDIEDLMVGSLWKDCLCMLLDVHSHVLQRLFVKLKESDMNLPIGDEDICITGLAPAFLVTMPLSIQVSVPQGGCAPDAWLWKNEGFHLILPTAESCRDQLLQGGISFAKLANSDVIESISTASFPLIEAISDHQELCIKDFTISSASTDPSFSSLAFGHSQQKSDEVLEMLRADDTEVFFSDAETSEEVYDRLFKEIKALQTPEECREFYDRPVFNNCLQNLRNAQQRYRDSYGGNRDDWAKMWAEANSSDSSRARKQAKSYDRDRKVCLALLYQVCDLCFRLPPTEDTVPSLKTRSIWPQNDDGVDGQYGLVKVFELRRITAIVVLCLPMDRANALYHKRNEATQELYGCWLGYHHVIEIGPKLQNKRFWWLLNTEELVFSPQERDLLEKWLQPARADHDSNPVKQPRLKSESQLSDKEKNLVVLFDGTGKDLTDENLSNVGKLERMLDQERCTMLYITGLGRFVRDKWKPDAKHKHHERIGGRGVLYKVVEAYKFLIRNYKEGCQIFVFGFSRGAHTARVLTSLVNTVGIMKEIGHAENAVGAFYANQKESPRREIREVADDLRTNYTKVYFLGIWDTVGSVYVPRRWLRFWPCDILFAKKEKDMTKRDESMTHLRHALAIDERRYYFRPTPCTISSNANVDAKQVWFVGCHGDVGGGHNEKKSGYSNISLEWMLSEASEAGLPLKDDWRSSESFASSSSRSSTEIHCIPYNESLKSWWWLCELIPHRSRKKDLKGVEKRCRYPCPTLGRRRRRMPRDDTIHESVLHRMDENEEYRPKNLLAYLELNGVQDISGMKERRGENFVETFAA